MRVEIGSDVYSSDGKKLGTVAGLVIDAGNKEVTRLVIGEGVLFREQRLVDISAVSRVDQNRVDLDVTEAAADKLPTFVTEEHVEASREDAQAIIMPAAGVGGPIFYDNPQTGAGYPGSDSFFDPAPIDPPVVEIESNLLESEVMIRRGADVISDDGHKLGTVDDVLFAEGGDLQGFVVKEGVFFRHDVTIPVAWVAEVDDQRVLLNVTRDAASSQ